jgi:hypothetical protein
MQSISGVPLRCNLMQRKVLSFLLTTGFLLLFHIWSYIYILYIWTYIRSSQKRF